MTKDGYFARTARGLAIGATVGLATLLGSVDNSKGDLIQFANVPHPSVSGISGSSAVIETYDHPDTRKGYDRFDHELDTSISPTDKNFVAYFPFQDDAGEDFKATLNFIPQMQVGDTYTAYLAFEDFVGVGTYSRNGIWFSDMALGDSDVNDFRYSISVDTDVDGINDHFESGLVSEIMATPGQTTGYWDQEVWAGVDLNNMGYHYGEITFTAIGEPTPAYHELTVGFKPSINGVLQEGGNQLLVTYGEDGATSARNDTVDESIGWGAAKFAATEEGDFGIYTRDVPFGDEILTKDARAEGDLSNILVETFTNKIYEYPDTWEKGVTWNEGGRLELIVDGNDAFFDEFFVTQKEPGCFNPRASLEGYTLQELDLLDGVDDGIATIDFGRIGSVGLFGPDTELDWWSGPFSAFAITPEGGVPWDQVPDTFYIESGTYAVAHPSTPEPSTFVLLAMAGIGAGVYALGRRKRKK